jgi:hypothetical protein
LTFQAWPRTNAGGWAANAPFWPHRLRYVTSDPSD